MQRHLITSIRAATAATRLRTPAPLKRCRNRKSTDSMQEHKIFELLILHTIYLSIAGSRNTGTCILTCLLLTACSTTVQHEAKPAPLSVGLGAASGAPALPTLDLREPAKEARYIDDRRTILLREYHLRSGTAPSAEQLVRNVDARDPITPTALTSAIRSFAAAQNDAFKRRDAASAVLEASSGLFSDSKPLQRVAVWHRVGVGPYDFQRKQFELCLISGCGGLRGGELRLGLGARDYVLTLRGLPSALALPVDSEATARSIEAAASMQTPRGMDALLVIDLLPQVGGSGTVFGELAGMAFYERTSFTQRRALPSPDALVLVYWLTPGAPLGDQRPASITQQKAQDPTSTAVQAREQLVRHLGLVPTRRPDHFENPSAGCGPVTIAIRPLAGAHVQALVAHVEDAEKSICYGSSGGRSVVLISDPPNTGWRIVMDVGSGGDPVAIQRAGHAFPDLVFRATACDNVWRWNGASYQHHTKVPTRPGGCTSGAY